ncbi:MAG: bifunctional isocitrate dehydrogenase kinase/phosphatase [Vicinamibacterales bacterium]
MATLEASAPVALDVARAILAGFDKHYRLFRSISRDAQRCFEVGHWAEIRELSRTRIDMYDLRVQEAVERVTREHPETLGETPWPAIKLAYASLLTNHQQPELAETFYNSVACRLLDRTYYNNDYIFWRPQVSTELIDSVQPTYRFYNPAIQGLRATLRQIVSDLGLASPWEDLDRDLAAALRAFRAALPRPLEVTAMLQVQVLSSLFFRNKGAYLVGRVLLNGVEQQLPFAAPILKNQKGELYLDAVLLRREELGTLFSLARVYFLADMEVPSAFVSFLKDIFPNKPKAELYIALGLQKQGKTLFYRMLFDHLKYSSDRFIVAPGVRGMVMLVFTLPSFPYVFKIIRDRFEPPKDVDRRKVIQQYQVVKHMDRVGRMADTLEYSDVALPLDRFDPDLLAELEAKTAAQLARDRDRLVIKHVYIERRMTPLDVYLRHADARKAERALFEYGQAIREMAGADIFPGDLLLKNFGVTRFGRVVFYDYDEIAPLAQCHFRRLPQPRSDEEETSGEPWFHVGPHDVFPEEFPRFLFASEAHRDIFMAQHGDLCTPEFWQQKQAQLQAGIEDDMFPYPAARRFQHRHA